MKTITGNNHNAAGGCHSSIGDGCFSFLISFDKGFLDLLLCLLDGLEELDAQSTDSLPPSSTEDPLEALLSDFFDWKAPTGLLSLLPTPKSVP